MNTGFVMSFIYTKKLIEELRKYVTQTIRLSQLIIANLLVCIGTILYGVSISDAKMSADWEAKRAQYKEVGKQACDGLSAFKKLKKQADQGDEMAAYWVYYTMRTNKCKNRSLSPKETHKYRLQTLASGYPIGLRFIGKDYMFGYGVQVDTQKGLDLLKESLSLGHEMSAGELAYIYGRGRGAPKNPELALKYYEQAIEMGVSSRNLEVVKRHFSSNLKEEATRIEQRYGKENKDNTIASQNNDLDVRRFAALVVSQGDGGFGFSNDYSTEHAAKNRAIDECRTRGGQQCDVVLLGEGKGCMAYYYAGGMATAHGWSMGPTRDAVQERASNECRKRNNNQACTDYAWVCNDRTEQAFNVILEKPMPVAATPGQCFQYMYAYCERSGDSRKNFFAAPRNTFDASDCKSEIDTNSVIRVDYNFKKNAWSKYGRTEWYGSARLAAAEKQLKDFRSKIAREYPACGANIAAYFVSRTNGGLADTIQRAQQDPHTTVLAD